jgi:predicted DNA binding protein
VEEAIKSAFELGYYDYPKWIRTDRLASKLGVKIGGIIEILRRAERNVIIHYFESEE